MPLSLKRRSSARDQRRIAIDPDTVLDLVIDALATHRLTTLVKDDKILEDVRAAVWSRYGSPEDEDAHKLSYFLTCPWCLSIYLGTLVSGLRLLWPNGWRPVAKALAFSTVTGLLSEAKD